MKPADAAKAAAAAAALELLRPGMLVGLGSGTTAGHFIDGVGRLVERGMRLSGVPTSVATAERARALGIHVVTEPDRPLDLAVDGADLIDPELRLVKGAGGALFREKLVAAAARRFVVIADESKVVPGLGRGPIPVEVLPYLWRETAHRLEELGAAWTVRGGEEQPFRTDNGSLILDLVLAEPIDDPEHLASRLERCLGVLEHGLFIGLAAGALIGGPAGVRVLGSVD